MEPRLLKGLHAEYVPAPWSGQNTSGIRVVGKTVLVLMDECSPKTSGGIELTPDIIERMSLASESGVIVAIAAGAFLLNEDMTPWSGERPKPGDRCYIEKYAGKLVKGRDGKTYRLMDYGAIGATYEPDIGAIAESDHLVRGVTAESCGQDAMAPPESLGASDGHRKVNRLDGDPPESLEVKGVHSGFGKRSA